jgi:transcription initiation factor TFIID subunit TAF12
MDDSPEMKKALTESAFREVNERIAERAQRFESGSTEFICECADPRCTNHVQATVDEYEQVREDGATFMVAPGHADGTIERLVEHRRRFMVVEKVHVAARALVRRLNPRAADS